MTQSLLSIDDLPEFSQIHVKDIEPAISQILQKNRAYLEQLLSSDIPKTWESLLEPLDDADDQLRRAWSAVGHLNGVLNSPELRDAFNACLPKLSEYSTDIGQNKKLYEAYVDILASDASKTFTVAQTKALKDAIRDFELAGVALPTEKKQRYKEIRQQLSSLQAKFSDQVLDATNAWSKLVTDESVLQGVPESTLAIAAQAAREKDNQSGWLLTLDFPCYQAIVTYADDRAIREEMYRAYSTRASDQGPQANQFDNMPLMEDILGLRFELAQLLGFANYADYSLATKMAESPAQVIEFLLDLSDKSLSQARAEYAELQAFAKQQDGIDGLQPWDVAYYGEKLRQQRYAISQEILRPYFPDTKVVAGLFAIVEKLFGIRVKENSSVDVWHEHAKYYDIEDQSGKALGGFYLDIYARSTKRGGAWMDECRVRRKTQHGVQTPIAFLTCNFAPPVDGKPSLLTHQEVTTLFHEFGHGLHHMLTQVDVASVSGINGVPWDAVELPSQFLENWCWQPEALAIISGHYQTDEQLPKELLDKMLAAKNFQAAMQMVRQIEFSLFDMRIHAEYDPQQGGRIYEILEEVRQQTAVIFPPEWNRFPNSFSHIFAGGYAAGYFSYKWAEVLAADAFSAFEEEGVFNAETGKRFRDVVLAQGGSKDAMDLFREFRGREPKIDALLRHSGF